MEMSEHATWTGSPESEQREICESISAVMIVGIGEIDAVFEAGFVASANLECLNATPISRLCNRFNIYRSYQQFFAGYDRNFADLCVEHHLLRLRNRLIFEAIGIVFFDVCFYRFCLGVMSETTHVPVHFVLRQDTQ
jgi:hypothetical protein